MIDERLSFYASLLLTENLLVYLGGDFRIISVVGTWEDEKVGFFGDNFVVDALDGFFIEVDSDT